MEIVRTGDVSLLVRDGEGNGNAAHQWEELMIQNAKQNNDLGFISYISNLRVYAQLLADYNCVKSSLIILMVKVDDSIIEWLGKKGYKIETSGANAYAESINTAMHRSEAMTTQLTMKRNKMAQRVKDGNDREVGYEEIIAGISSQLGYEVSTDITLARFNEYKKIIKARNEAKNKVNGRH